MRRLLLLPTVIGIVYSKSLPPTEEEAVWNNFKLHNVFFKWRIELRNSTGIVFKAEDSRYLDPVVLVVVGRHNSLTVSLPLKDGNGAVYSTQIPSSSFPIDIIMVLSDELIIATTKCEKLLQTSTTEIDLKIPTPKIWINPEFEVQTGSGNPLPNFCSVLKKSSFLATTETEENQKRGDEVPSLSPEDMNITCTHDKEVFHPGQKRYKDECVECECNSNGTFDCSTKGCPLLPNCTYPLHDKDTCCPSRCAKQCEFNGRIHHHSAVFWPELCVRCECNDGAVQCKFNHEHMCPTLPCPKEHQRKEDGICCPLCVDFDFCSVNPCHEDATCNNTPEGAKCRCKEGFFGNGTHCYDIDECSFNPAAQEQLGGCHGSTCVNTRGSFRCDCLPGHPRIDERTCLNLIRI